MSSTAGEFLLRPIAAGDVRVLKTLNSIIFPVKYHDQLYKDALACGAVTQLAFFEDQLVGAIVCRLEARPEDTAHLYIASLGVLAPYRERGLGSRLLSTTLSKCEEDDAITQAYLHVHVDNEEAIAFYRRRGFVVAETLRGYYPRLDPPDAVVLTRPLAPCTTIGSG